MDRTSSGGHLARPDGLNIEKGFPESPTRNCGELGNQISDGSGMKRVLKSGKDLPTQICVRGEHTCVQITFIGEIQRQISEAGRLESTHGRLSWLTRMGRERPF